MIKPMPQPTASNISLRQQIHSKPTVAPHQPPATLEGLSDISSCLSPTSRRAGSGHAESLPSPECTMLSCPFSINSDWHALCLP